MLGVFDSGFGGMTILRAIHDRLPSLSTLYLGDHENAPYGSRSQEEIFGLTLAGVRHLFSHGCPLIIIACNTASAQALRRIQQEVMPVQFPGRRVLGVIRPTVEAVNDMPGLRRLGLFATHSTVTSNAYVAELEKFAPGITLAQLPCPGLVDRVEEGREQAMETDHMVGGYARALRLLDPSLQAAILGCTHFPLLHGLFRKHLPDNVALLDQGPLVARSLEDYLDRHPEILSRIDKAGRRDYLGPSPINHHLARRFYDAAAIR